MHRGALKRVFRVFSRVSYSAGLAQGHCQPGEHASLFIFEIAVKCSSSDYFLLLYQA